MTKFQGVTGDLLKVDSRLTKAPIQSTVLWQGQNVLPDGGGGGPNNEPSGGHHGRPPSGHLDGHLGGPPNGPLSEHSRKPSIGLLGRHFGETSSGPLEKLLGEPLSGTFLGPYLGGGLLYVGTPPLGTWTRHPWRP